MPIYDLILIIQKLEHEALKQALKRSANYIFEQDGIIRKIENLGFRTLPYSISAKGKNHRAANYFIFNYDIAVVKPKILLEKLKLDLDIVRATNYMCAESPMEFHKEKEKQECTLHVDLLPAPSRPTVIALQKIGKKKKLREFRGQNFDNTDFLIF